MPSPPSIRSRLVRVDVLAGLAMLAISAAVWHEVLPLDVGTLSYFGPGFLPRFLAAILTLISLALIAMGLFAHEAETLVLKVRGPLFVALGVLFFAATIRGLGVGPLEIPQLGLLLAAPVTVVLAGYGTREARLRELIALGLALTALATLVFSDFLSTTLPIFPEAIERAMPHTWREWPKRAVCLLYLALAVMIALPLIRAARAPRPEQPA